MKTIAKPFQTSIDIKKSQFICRLFPAQSEKEAKEIIKELYEGLDKLYLSGLSAKQITFIEQLQDKTEQFLNEVEK